MSSQHPKPGKKDGMYWLQVDEQVNVIEFTYNVDIVLPKEEQDEE